MVFAARATGVGSVGRCDGVGEAHSVAAALSRRGSATAAAVNGLSAAHRVCLTGTPVQNRVGELWALFEVTAMVSWVTVMVMAMGDGDVELMVMRACGRSCGRGDMVMVMSRVWLWWWFVVMSGSRRRTTVAIARRLARPRHRNAKIESERARAIERSPGIIYCRCRRVRRRTAPHKAAAEDPIWQLRCGS